MKVPSFSYFQFISFSLNENISYGGITGGGIDGGEGRWREVKIWDVSNVEMSEFYVPVTSSSLQ